MIPRSQVPSGDGGDDGDGDGGGDGDGDGGGAKKLFFPKQWMMMIIMVTGMMLVVTSLTYSV